MSFDLEKTDLFDLKRIQTVLTGIDKAKYKKNIVKSTNCLITSNTQS